MAKYMMVDPPMTIDSIDLLTEIDVGTGAATTTPVWGMAVVLTARPGRIVDAFNDPENAQAMKLRAGVDDRDGPVATYTSSLVKEIAY